MRSILVYADRSAAMPARVQTALSLARATGGHVTFVVDTPISRFVAMDPMGGSYVARDALEQALADDDRQAEAISAQLSHEDVPFDVIRCEEEPLDALAAAARLADVVIVPRDCGFAGALALAARCPVLVLPESGELAAPMAVACIAWDGGDEAALALRSAAPVLKACGEVHVLTVAEKPGGFAPTEAMTYLSRHGVKAEYHELSRTGSTEETLASACARLGADMLVMGAFGHSRMREYLFGGVTRYFLEEVGSPALLLAH